MNDEELLNKLLSCFYENSNGNFEWGYREGTTVLELLGLDVQTAMKNKKVGSDIYEIEGAAVVRASGPVTMKNVQRPAIGVTHHIIDFPKAGFWRPDLGVFVVPKDQVRII